jgi:hypothetical protein
MKRFIPNGILRYSPFFSNSIKNEVIIKNIIHILNDYKYNGERCNRPIHILNDYKYNRERYNTPIIYFGGINDLYNNYLAIDYTLRNKFPEIPDTGININYWIKKHYNDGFVCDTNEYQRHYQVDERIRETRQKYDVYIDEYVDSIYKNTILTRLWFQKSDKEVDVNVLMELGSFSYKYLMKINNPHDFYIERI